MATVVEEARPFIIPTIDIAPYLADPVSVAAARVIAEVRQACTTTGFFSLVGHGISRSLQDDVLAGAEAFFALPLQDKAALVSPVLKGRGYEALGSQTLQAGTPPDLKEGFYIGRDLPPDSTRYPSLVGRNMFPPGLADAVLREPVEAYYDAVFALGCTVLRILARGLPYGDDVFDDFVSGDPVCAVRLLHYPPTTAAEQRLGAGAHTDFGAVTLLLQDGAGGLEVLDESTGAWVGVAPDRDAYVVNVGDMLHMWTRGAYKSNTHRVINRSGRHRYSVPFFFDGNPNARLAPLDGGRTDGPVLTAGEHMMERLGTTYGEAHKTGTPDMRTGEEGDSAV